MLFPRGGIRGEGRGGAKKEVAHSASFPLFFPHLPFLFLEPRKGRRERRERRKEALGMSHTFCQDREGIGDRGKGRRLQQQGERRLEREEKKEEATSSGKGNKME